MLEPVARWGNFLPSLNLSLFKASTALADGTCVSGLYQSLTSSASRRIIHSLFLPCLRRPLTLPASIPSLFKPHQWQTLLNFAINPIRKPPLHLRFLKIPSPFRSTPTQVWILGSGICSAVPNFKWVESKTTQSPADAPLWSCSWSEWSPAPWSTLWRPWRSRLVGAIGAPIPWGWSRGPVRAIMRRANSGLGVGSVAEGLIIWNSGARRWSGVPISSSILRWSAAGLARQCVAGMTGRACAIRGCFAAIGRRAGRNSVRLGGFVFVCSLESFVLACVGNLLDFWCSFRSYALFLKCIMVWVCNWEAE